MADETAAAGANTRGGGTIIVTNAYDQLTGITAQLCDALSVAREQLNAANARLEDLKSRRRAIELAAPHAEDIVAAFMRGIDAAGRDFMDQLGSYLTPRNGLGAARAVQSSPAQMLTVEAVGQDNKNLLPSPNLTRTGPGINAAALTFFLRDRIAADIPALVDRLYPDAQQGMKQADRDAALAAIDAELADEQPKRDALFNAVLVAQRGVGSAG